MAERIVGARDPKPDGDGSAGLPTSRGVRVGLDLGIAGMAIGSVMSIVYWVLWPSVVAWLNSA